MSMEWVLDIGLPLVALLVSVAALVIVGREKGLW